MECLMLSESLSTGDSVRNLDIVHSAASRVSIMSQDSCKMQEGIIPSTVFERELRRRDKRGSH